MKSKKPTEDRSIRINPDCISEFSLSVGNFEVQFKDGSRLKWPAKSSVYAYEGNIQMRVVPTLTPGIIINSGGKSVDGKLRCVVCDGLITDDNRIGKQHCWDCVTNSEKSPGGWSLVETVRVLGGKDPEGVVKKYLQSIEIEDPMNLVAEDHIQEIYRRKKKL